jgi:hypothetical protein
MADRPDGLLADALAACGVDPKLVEIETDDLCQEDVLTIAGVSHSDTTLACLADLYLTFPSRFVFATTDLQETFERLVMNAPAMLKMRNQMERDEKQLLEAADLAAFEAFDVANESLRAFAARVEVACGFRPGELLSVHENGAVFIEPARPAELDYADFRKVLALLNQAAPGIEVAVLGNGPA